MSIKSMRDAPNESFKCDNLKRYKSLIKKKKKRHYKNRKQEKLLHLSKLDPKMFWRQSLNRKTKENNMIPLKDWNSYLKNIFS
jgi:hypothetical protein